LEGKTQPEKQAKGIVTRAQAARMLKNHLENA